MSSSYMFKDEEMESVMGAIVCCPDIPSGLKFLLPQLLRVLKPGYRNFSLGIISQIRSCHRLCLFFKDTHNLETSARIFF